MMECCKKINNARLRTSCQENLLVKTSHASFDKQIRTSGENYGKNAYQLYAGNMDMLTDSWRCKRLNCRQVYLGNISNL